MWFTKLASSLAHRSRDSIEQESCYLHNRIYNCDNLDLLWLHTYCQTSNIRSGLGNKLVDHSDVAGASPLSAAATMYSFSTSHLALMDLERQLQDVTRKIWVLGFGVAYTKGFVECLAFLWMHTMSGLLHLFGSPHGIQTWYKACFFLRGGTLWIFTVKFSGASFSVPPLQYQKHHQGPGLLRTFHVKIHVS